MAAQKYRLTRDIILAEEFKSAVDRFNGTLKGLEERAKKCESLKYLDKDTSNIVLRSADGRSRFDWEIYLQNEKRKLESSTVLPKLKDIHKQGKQRKTSFIGSVKEVLPSWAKKKVRGRNLLLTQVIKDLENCKNLIDNALEQINSMQELTSMAGRILQENENNQVKKELQQLISRWNAMNENVVNNSNRLENLGYQVEREYRKLSQWHDKCDSVNSWLDISEQHLKEDKSESTIPGLKETLQRNQERVREVKRRRPQVEDVYRMGEELLKSGRLDVADAERLERFNDALSTRYQGYGDQLTDLQNKLYSNIHQLQKEPEKKDAAVVEASLKPEVKHPVKIISPFRKKAGDGNNNERKIHESLNQVKAKMAEYDSSTQKEKERIQQRSVEAFETSIKTCEIALNEFDEESLQDFTAVGSTITEVRKQLDDIQALELKMVDEDKSFGYVKETFEESEKKSFLPADDSRKLREKVDELNSRWEEMWRAHDVNKDRLVQAILIMGGEWMGKVNSNLDELEGSIDSIEIVEDDLQALRAEQEKQKNVMNKISSYEEAVHGAVDVAREVHRRNLVDADTAKTIESETQALEDRLERLKDEAQQKKKRMFAAVSQVEKATFVNETMVCSSVTTVHSKPDSLHTDEGFVEPESKFSSNKPTYEFLISQKKNAFRNDHTSMTKWLNETEGLIKSLKPDMDSKKASKIQRKLIERYELVEEKQAVVDRINRVSREIENETLEPYESEAFVNDAEALSKRWKKAREILDSYEEKMEEVNTGSGSTNCCFAFMKRRLFPAWTYS